MRLIAGWYAVDKHTTKFTVEIKEVGDVMAITPVEQYGELMWNIRKRFDLIKVLRNTNINEFSRSETAAFHGRKIVESIAFGCLVAVDNSLKQVPRDAKGQWNAEKLFKNLRKKGVFVLPSPSLIRNASQKEKVEQNTSVIIEGIPERRLSYEELIEVYQDLHAWLHEINPYVHSGNDEFASKRSGKLWGDLDRLKLFVERHFISIQGVGFFCTLWDTQDNQTKVLPLSKVSS